MNIIVEISRSSFPQYQPTEYSARVQKPDGTWAKEWATSELEALGRLVMRTPEVFNKIVYKNYQDGD